MIVTTNRNKSSRHIAAVTLSVHVGVVISGIEPKFPANITSCSGIFTTPCYKHDNAYPHVSTVGIFCQTRSTVTVVSVG